MLLFNSSLSILTSAWGVVTYIANYYDFVFFGVISRDKKYSYGDDNSKKVLEKKF